MVGQAIGDMLPAAVGVAISPLPIIAVVLLLGTARGGTNGIAYAVGAVLGVMAFGTILLLVAGGANAYDEDEAASWVGWLKLILGVGLLLLALKEWRGRPRDGEQAMMPKWLGGLEALSPGKAAVTGALLSTVNPKNLVLIVAGVAAIAETGISGGEQAAALAVFTLIASIGIVTPIVIHFALGDRAGPLLERLRNWLAENNAVIIALVLLLIGVKLIGDAVSALS
jgi:threonine/homoserine/homoserine lactone efflux protein